MPNFNDPSCQPNWAYATASPRKNTYDPRALSPSTLPTMEREPSAVERRRDELINDLRTRLTKAGDSSALTEEALRQIIEATCTFRPPSGPPLTTELITLREGGKSGSSSVKPGNITFNPGKLIMAANAGTLALVGGVTLPPWTIPLTVMAMWEILWSRLNIEIQERDATVLWAIWVHRDDDTCVRKADVHRLTNAERTIYGRQPLSPQEVDDAVDLLRRMRCIKESRNDSTKWFVTEWIRVDFSKRS